MVCRIIRITRQQVGGNMKTIKYAVLLAAVIFVVALWMLRPDEVITAPLAETKPAETQPLQPQVTKQDILKLFHDYNDREPDSKQALDCAVVTDSAYGLLGVVLYSPKRITQAKGRALPVLFCGQGPRLERARCAANRYPIIYARYRN